MSLDPDGFRRERAVQLLGVIGDPAAIPYLLKRANDWVPEVRTAARKALYLMLRPSTAANFVAHLPALLHLQICQREDHSELIHAVQVFLLREENVEYLIAGLQSHDVHVARITTRLLADRRPMNTVELLRIGLSHHDVVVRAIATELLKEVDAGGFGEVIDIALRDPHMPVRREALQQVLSRNSGEGLRIARAFLFDVSPSIREIAAKRLLQAGVYVEASLRRH